MSRILKRTASVISAVADGIAEDQTLTGAGELTLTAGAVVLSPGRRVVIDSDGDDSGVNFTVTGYRNGELISEVVAGENASAVTTTLIFDSVISISADGATADAVRAGWGTESVTSWMHIAGLRGRLVVDVPKDATVSYAVEATAENMLRASGGHEPLVTELIAATASQTDDVELDTPWSAIRLVVASADADLTMRFIPYRGTQ